MPDMLTLRALKDRQNLCAICNVYFFPHPKSHNRASTDMIEPVGSGRRPVYPLILLRRLLTAGSDCYGRNWETGEKSVGAVVVSESGQSWFQAEPEHIGGLVTMLEAAHQTRCSGTILVPVVDGGVVRISVRRGDISTASDGKISGMPALLRAIRSGENGFHLGPSEPIEGEAIDLLTPVILETLQEAVHQRQADAQLAVGYGAAPGAGYALINSLLMTSGTMEEHARRHEAGEELDVADVLAAGEVRIRSATKQPSPDGPEREDSSLFDLDDLIPEAARDGAFLGNEAERQELVPQESGWEPPPIGHMLGRCYLSSLVGEGATCLVYRALHLSLKIDVAVKVFKPQMDDGPIAALSTKEALLLARLNHPAVLRVLDYDNQDRYPHMVMEYVDGMTMQEMIQQDGRMSAHRVLGIAIAAADGLKHAHEQGITHCDIKPGNLLVGKDGIIKIADLGVAKVTNQTLDLDDEGEPTHIVGTPAYIAPEQARYGLAGVDYRADIYSLGATMFHALSGEPPFLYEDPLQVLVAHINEAPRHLVDVVPGVNEALAGIVDRCLAKEPDDRFQSFDDFIAELRRVPETDTQRIKNRSADQGRGLLYRTMSFLKRRLSGGD